MNVARLLLLLSALLPALAGCGPKGKSPKLATFHRPELLYLKAQPCSRLVVEIDTVEGTKIPPGTIEALRDSLTEWCDKPEGITFIREKPIPLAAAKNSHPHLVALEHMDGPLPKPGVGPAAFMYFLFYDSRRMKLRKPLTPHATLLYPCAVYFDMAHWPIVSKLGAKHIIKHEAAHLLGLCKSTTHGDGAHCSDPSCLMRSTLSVSRSLIRMMFRQPLGAELCDKCRQELAAARQAEADPRMSFDGTALVRREDGYSVTQLPWWVEASFGPRWKVDGVEVLTSARRTIRELKARARRTKKNQTLDVIQLHNAPADLADKRAVVDRLTKDPDPMVAAWARHTLKALDKAATQPAATTQAVAEGPQD